MSLQTTSEPQTAGSVWVAAPLATLNGADGRPRRALAISLPWSIQTTYWSEIAG